MKGEVEPVVMPRYGVSGVRETIGRINMVAIIDNEDNQARIAFVPFDRRHPPLEQPDVMLIVDALNVRHREAAVAEALAAEREDQNATIEECADIALAEATVDGTDGEIWIARRIADQILALKSASPSPSIANPSRNGETL